MALCLDYLLIRRTSTSLLNKHDYELALKNSGYKTKLAYKTTNESSNVRNRGRNRARKILWFSLPYNIAIANKLGKEFFTLWKKKFSPSNNRYKIFSKNTVKLTNSCMPNMANLINKSNTKKALIRPNVNMNVKCIKCRCLANNSSSNNNNSNGKKSIRWFYPRSF